jgi:hypothetical protein
MRSRRQLEITTLGSSSWIPCAPQGLNGTDGDDNMKHCMVLPPYNF